MTALDIIDRSLKLLGVVAEGESSSSESANDALITLNDLIDSWSNQNLFIYAKTREVFSLTNGTASYTLGSGATFDTTRPEKILEASILVQSTYNFEVPVKILTIDEWSRVLTKTTTSNIPIMMYPDYGYPNITLNFYPVPSDSRNSVVLYSWKPLTTQATLATTFSLPPGYMRALRYNLAMELAPEYGKTATPEIINSARESVAAIKTVNQKPHYMYCDEAVLPRKTSFNWMTGK